MIFAEVPSVACGISKLSKKCYTYVLGLGSLKKGQPIWSSRLASQLKLT